MKKMRKLATSTFCSSGQTHSRCAARKALLHTTSVYETEYQVTHLHIPPLLQRQPHALQAAFQGRRVVLALPLRGGKEKPEE